MKLSKQQKSLYVWTIVLTLIALAMSLVSGLVIEEKWYFAILMFFLVLCVGYGVFYLIAGIVMKKPFSLFISAILCPVSTLYIFLHYTGLDWWISVVVAIALCIIIGALSLLRAGNNTDNVSLNKDPEYKDYKERQEEKEEENKKEENELPKLKSFKD